MVKVSVIMPVYNVEKWVEESIRSVQNGGYENIEIVVVNDASPDGSKDIVERMAIEDKRVIHIVKEVNEGSEKARQTAIDRATGDFILFVDSDDYIAAGAIAKMVESAEGCDMVYGNHYMLYEDDTTEICHFDRVTKGVDYIKEGREYYMWMRLIKRSLFCDIKPQGSQICEDRYMMLQLLPRMDRVCYINEPLYYYRYNRTSLTHNSRKKFVSEWLRHAAKVEGLIDDLDISAAKRLVLRYDNIQTIYRFLREGDKSSNEYMTLCRTLVNSILQSVPLKSVNSVKRVKQYLFLLFAWCNFVLLILFYIFVPKK